MRHTHDPLAPERAMPRTIRILLSMVMLALLPSRKAGHPTTASEATDILGVPAHAALCTFARTGEARGDSHRRRGCLGHRCRVEVPDDSDYLPMDRAPERGCCRDARPVSARRLADVCVAFQEDR